MQQKKPAIVLSGGGAFGAFEVGVVAALLEGRSPATGYRPLHPEVITATSVGSFNAAALMSKLPAGGPAAARYLERIWLERIADRPGSCGNGVYRIRGNPFQFLDPACLLPPWKPVVELAGDGVFFAAQGLIRAVSCVNSSGPPIDRALEQIDIGALFDTQPFRELVHETVDLDVLLRSPIALRIAATNWSTSQLRVFTNRDMIPGVGDRAVEASASIPAIFPPVQLGEELFVDGGLLLSTPLSPAVRAGAEVLHVVFLNPDVEDFAPVFPRSTAAQMYRSYAIFVDGQFRADLRQAREINRGLEIARLGNAARSVSSREGARATLRTLAKSARRLESGIKSFYRPLEIHLYRLEAQDLSRDIKSFLDFSIEEIEQLIRSGYENAASHDCKASGCLTPAVPA